MATKPVTTITHSYHQINAELATLGSDIEKTETGNEAASTRVRVGLSAVSKQITSLRALLLNHSKELKAAKKAKK